jgi:hypothetical protein
MSDNSKSSVSDWGNHINSGLEGVGTFKADLIMVVGLILSAILIVVGIYMIFHNDDNNYIRIKGVVSEPNCTKSSTTVDKNGNQSDVFKCNLVVTYMIDSNTFSKKIYVSGGSSYIKDEPIDLMVLKSNHNDAQIAFMGGSQMGSMFIGAALTIVALSYLNYYMTHNYRIFAASQGVNTIVSLFR